MNIDPRVDIVVDKKLKEIKVFNEAIARAGGVIFTNSVTKIVLDSPGDNTFTGALSTTSRYSDIIDLATAHPIDSDEPTIELDHGSIEG